MRNNTWANWRRRAGAAVTSSLWLGAALTVLASSPSSGQPLPQVHTPYGGGAVQSGKSSVARPPRNCTEARAMGLTNIPRGSPYYGSHLDRDNDGVGCESR